MGIRNEVIASGGVAQDLLQERHSWGGLIINPLDDDLWIQFGADAGVDSGELIYAGNPARFSARDFPEFNGRVSVYSATTTRFTVRPTA